MGKLIRNKNTDLLSSVYKEDELVGYRKELNPLGYVAIFCVCSFCIFTVTKNYVSTKSEKNLQAHLVILKKDYDNKLEQMSKKIKQQSTMPGSRFLRQELAEIKGQNALLYEREIESQNLIDKQKTEIRELKESLHYFLEVEVSKSKHINTKILPYNSTNFSNVYFRHNLEISNLQQSHKAKKEAFLKYSDNSDPSVLKKYQSIVDLHKIELKELKNKLYKKRKMFREKMYINLAEND